MSSPYVRFWYAIAVAFVACLVAAAAALLFADYVQRQNDRRWCALLTDVSRGQRESPPQTASGRRFAANIDDLRREFGCPAD